MIVLENRRNFKPWAPTGKTEVWQDYYQPREANADYADYWEEIVDPDGVRRVRDCDEERFRYLADVAEEINYVNDLKPQCVLDFGAGLGWMLSAINAKAKTAIEVCSKAVKRLQHQGIVVHRDIADVETHSQDVVIAHHVFEHLLDPVGAIAHVRRILRNGGHLVLGTPDFGSVCAERFGSNYRMLHDQTHCSLFTLESMTRMLRDNAFTIHKVSFPFPERYATAENFMRWNDTSKTSPAWPGNWMTFFCRR